MNVIRFVIAILIFVSCSFSYAAHSHEYRLALDYAYKSYRIAFSELNKTFGSCNLQKRTDIDFKRVASEIPEDLNKQQLAAALFLMQKRHSDTCVRLSLGNYELKAYDLKSALIQAKNHHLRIYSAKKIDKIQKLLASRNETIFFHPDSYFKLLAEYQSISKKDRKKIESIPELQTDYDLVKMLKALGK